MVITSSLLKDEAKRKISGQIFTVFLVLFVVTLVMNGFSSVQSVYDNVQSFINNFSSFEEGRYLPGLEESEAIVRTSPLGYMVSTFITLWGILVLPLSVAMAHYALSVARGERITAGAGIGGVFSESVRNYGNYLGTMFLTNLFIYLWTLLLIIPGIVKSCEYMFVRFIQAEYPTLSGRQCRSLSSRITNGYKWDVFLFHLSFLGWWILVLLTFGLAGIYVLPYYHTAAALFYDNLKEDALRCGRILPQELGLDPAGYAAAQTGVPLYPPQWGYAQPAPVPPYAGGGYSNGGASVPPVPTVRNTPQMLKEMVVSRYPGRMVSRSGVPSLPLQDALWLVEECRLNGFVVLGVDAYFPNGGYAPNHSLPMNAIGPNPNSWGAVSQYLLQKAQNFELTYEILF